MTERSIDLTLQQSEAAVKSRIALHYMRSALYAIARPSVRHTGGSQTGWAKKPWPLCFTAYNFRNIEHYLYQI